MDHTTGWVCAEYIASERTKYPHLLQRKKKRKIVGTGVKQLNLGSILPELAFIR